MAMPIPVALAEYLKSNGEKLRVTLERSQYEPRSESVWKDLLAWIASIKGLASEADPYTDTYLRIFREARLLGMVTRGPEYFTQYAKTERAQAFDEMLGLADSLVVRAKAVASENNRDDPPRAVEKELPKGDQAAARKRHSSRRVKTDDSPKVGKKPASTLHTSKRPPLPQNVETDILMRSGRRCCICFVLRGDSETKKGQIAHLDGNPKNNAVDNLAFLCLEHHDEYDSRTRQSKGLTSQEVKRYRERLHRALTTASKASLQVTGDVPSPSEVVTYWKTSGNEPNRRLSGYLDAVAAEAMALADYWNKIAANLEREIGRPNAASSEVVRQIQQLGLLSITNPEYTRIVLHYRALSRTTSDLVTKETRTDLADALSAIIRARGEIMDSLKSACQMLRDDGSLPEDILAQARNALSALTWEAAALDVLAKRHKASE